MGASHCGRHRRHAGTPEVIASAPQAPAPGAACSLRIVAVNDVYELENLPRLKALVAAKSQGWRRENVVTTLAGDFLAPSLLSSLDSGVGMVRALNEIPMDYVCFGNHESDIAYPKLLQRIDEFRGTWLNSNMPGFNPELPSYAVRRLVGNDGSPGARTVAFIGLCIGGGRFGAIYRHGAFGGAAGKIVPVLEAAQSVHAELRRTLPEVDEVIPLTHQNLPEDIVLAEMDLFPVIIAGHDHDVVNEAHGGRACPVVKAGSDAEHAAIIDLVWPADPKAPPKVTVSLEPVAGYEPDAELAAKIERISRPARELEGATVYELRQGEELSSVGVRSGDASMARLVATALRDCLRCDAAVINSGAVRGNKVYTKGISYGDLKRECPFPSPIVVTRMPFEVLRGAVQESRRPWWDVPEGAEPGEAPSSLQVDDGLGVDGAHAPTSVKSQPPQGERLYAVACDVWVLRKNAVFRDYCERFPERVPPEDAGRPVLPLLAEFFCGRLWKQLIDAVTLTRPVTAKSARLSLVSSTFDFLDVDKDGVIDAQELRDAIGQCLGDELTSSVVVELMISMLDQDSDGLLSKDELRAGVTRMAVGLPTVVPI